MSPGHKDLGADMWSSFLKKRDQLPYPDFCLLPSWVYKVCLVSRNARVSLVPTRPIQKSAGCLPLYSMPLWVLPSHFFLEGQKTTFFEPFGPKANGFRQVNDSGHCFNIPLTMWPIFTWFVDALRIFWM
jgi:hypothetical protein